MRAESSKALPPSVIETSLFELFKSGPGPSSSHTLGPMKAGYEFQKKCAALPALADLSGEDLRFRSTLYGSLSATGAGHGTDAAIVAGLLGNQPSHCPPGLLRSIGQDRHADHQATLGPVLVHVGLDDIVRGDIAHRYPFSNTLTISLQNGRGETLATEEYYSVGGGFLQWKGYVPPLKEESRFMLTQPCAN